ncbi:MAG: ComF family protein [Armatimonadota bacterium]
MASRAQRRNSQSLGSALLDLVAPPKCGICYEVQAPPICEECREKLASACDGACPRCGTGPAVGCPYCREIGYLNALRSVARYDGAGGIAVRRLKFSRFVPLSDPMSEMMRTLFDEWFAEVDAIVPVPMHWLRLSVRGFNQSLLLCRALPQELVRPALLRRVRFTRQQARLRGRERQRSLRGAFQAAPAVSGLRVLLVDDVVTTGATLRECADTLRAAGASWVGALTFARELPRG